MIYIEESKRFYDGSYTLEELFSKHDLDSTKKKMDVLVDVVKKLPVNGCITGSYWLDDFDPDGWQTDPDVDLFVYSEDDLIKACTLAEFALQMVPGKGTPRSTMQEYMKLQLLDENGVNYKFGVTSYSFHHDGVTLNITYKCKKVKGKTVPLATIFDVLSSFDMSIVMQGYDIQSHVFTDLRPGNVDHNKAVPNPYRKQNCMTWTVAKWIRQFDRVVKYYNRGYDTRPMAAFYLRMIDECLENGCVFDTESSKESFTKFSEEFKAQRDMIKEWLNEHKED